MATATLNVPWLPAARRVVDGLTIVRGGDGRSVIEVTDAVQLAELLAERSTWPNGPTVHGYMWGRTVWEIAALVGEQAARNKIVVAVTGRTALAYLGVMTTSSPPDVRVWVDAGDRELAEVAPLLGLEPAPVEVRSSHRASPHRIRCSTLEGDAK